MNKVIFVVVIVAISYANRGTLRIMEAMQTWQHLVHMRTAYCQENLARGNRHFIFKKFDVDVLVDVMYN
jgi:hypothetical protein